MMKIETRVKSFPLLSSIDTIGRFLFYMLAIDSVSVIFFSHNFDARINFPLMGIYYLGNVYYPEAYKVLAYFFIYWLVLRPKFKRYALFAFLFFYPLSETIGNTYYLIYHIVVQAVTHQTPYMLMNFLAGNQFYYIILIMNPLTTFVSYKIIKPTWTRTFWDTPLKDYPLYSKQRGLAFAVWGFIGVIFIESLLGYRFQFNSCCEPLHINLTYYPMGVWYDVIWSISYFLVVIFVTLNLDGSRYN